eukprot:TRINITY_DN4090_c0_g1_i4.p1 TRINITY_DN4090_c0_g1~~TRINITY_DN4090_c0_g1_i4.p1  ORF type:complete len:167 (-),score=30.74 TRINITY_DN4090_c0_g1_i4:154-654(-)
MPSVLQPKCEAGNVTLQDIVGQAFSAYPAVPFGFINSKEDIVQRTYYSAIAATFGDKVLLKPTDYYAGVNHIWERFYAAHPNVVTFAVTGSQHCFTPTSLVYSADTTGKHGGGKQGHAKLLDWLHKTPLLSGNQISSHCSGAAEPAGATGVTYCDTALDNRTFVHP